MDQVVDEIRGRFGYQSIQRAFMYQDKICLLYTSPAGATMIFHVLLITFAFFSGWHTGGKSIFQADTITDSAEFMVCLLYTSRCV